ncbi:MAG: UvrD-helicase domain-containing protein [Bacteroidetes bacterium]|nr:UvrD-helicase domain-containing protein [Bacteroidota bacterium]
MPFIIYRSSAGSGKTFTLVKEYLKIVLVNPAEFRHILALTFTNKAAQEMKDRVLLYLRQLCDKGVKGDKGDKGDKGPIDGLLRMLVEETGLDERVIIQRAKKVLELILHQYSDFAITTIDSFMHRVIRIFAHDLHLPLDFEVELDADLLISQAVNNLIRQVGTQPGVTRTLVDFILYKTENEEGWNIEKDLESITRQLFQESGQVFMDIFRKQPIDLEEFSDIFKRIRSFRKAFEKEMKGLGAQAVEMITGAGLSMESFYYGKSGLGKYFFHLSEGNFDRIEPNSYVSKTIEEDIWYTKTAEPGVRSAIDAIKPALQDIYFKINELRESEFPLYITYGILEKSILPMSVLNEIDKELQEIKKENNLLPIGEFNKRIADSVLGEPIPFIFERIGEWYHHILLDEFQDTSVLQWLNLMPLVENSLAGGYSSILVGDGKQAIYRWRNGDVEQFSRLPEVYVPFDADIPEGRRLALARNYEPRGLTENYRTSAEIVNFNNEVFTALARLIPGNLQSIYDNVIQKPLDSKPGGYVSVEFTLPSDKELTLNDTHLIRILEIIRSCREDGYRYREIAILCRSNVNGSLVSRFLMDNNISVSSSESVLLKNSPKVNVLIACLKMIANPADQVSQEVLSRFVNEKRDLVFLLKDSYRGIPVYELTEKLVRDLGMAGQPDPFIIFFLDAVLQFSQKNETSVAAFIEWWEENMDNTSLKTPDDYDAVRVMTIHKAKGLEFKVVIYPFARERMKATRSEVWVKVNSPQFPSWKTALIPLKSELEKSTLAEVYHEEMAKTTLDFVNMLYVVLTRPKDRLYVLSERPGKNYADGKKVSDLLGIYLASLELDPLTQARYVRGEERKVADPEALTEASFNFNKLYSVDWQKRVAIRRNHPDDWDVRNPDLTRSYGNLVHSILSFVKCRDDIPLVLETFQSGGMMQPSEKETIKKQLASLLMDERMGMFFSKDSSILNEAEILAPSGKTIRPDRVVLFPDRTLILDYKTGEQKPFHSDQVLQYKEYLKEMGYPAVEAYLLYLNQPHQLVNV